MSNPLEILVERARREPFFLASILEAFARADRLDDEALVTALGCKREELTMIRLCRSPRQDGPGFREDIDDICDRFHLDFDRLATIVKRGQVIVRMQGAETTEAGFLMAARDREESPP